MASVTYGVMPYDPETEKCFVNAIGSNKTEAGVNLSQIKLPDEILQRTVMVDVEIMFEIEERG